MFCQTVRQLFFGMNEYGEVLTWRLTKSPAFSEIEDLLVDLNQRHVDAGIKVNNPMTGAN
jgi:hypothetical protein